MVLATGAATGAAIGAATGTTAGHVILKSELSKVQHVPGLQAAAVFGLVFA